MVLAAIIALAVIALRLVLFYTGRPPEGTEFMIVHFLAVATVVFFTNQRLLARDRYTPFPTLMRDGFKSAAVYALLCTFFIWVYFTYVEDTYFTQRVNEMVAKGIAEGQPENIIRPRMQQFFTPFNYSSITFFTLLITGAFNALLLGVLHHKLLRKMR